MKKQAKLAFDRLEEEMEVIPEEEQESYMGGTASGGYGSGGYGTGNSFVNSLLSGHVIDLSGLSQSEKEKIRNRLVEIDSEPMGNALLHDIKNSMTHPLSISFHFGGSNEYNHDSHTIYLSNDSKGDAGGVRRLLVHEAAHADLEANGMSGGQTVDEESQAYLVMGKFAKEYSGSSLKWTSSDNGGGLSPAEEEFGKAAHHIMQHGFSQSYFDHFAQSFKDGSSMNKGGGYDAYTDYDSDPNPYVSTLFSFDGALSASGY